MEGHLHRIGGWRRMTASYSLVHVIPGTDESRRGVMRHVKLQLPRHLLLVSRGDFISLVPSRSPRRVALWCFPTTTTTSTVNPPQSSSDLQRWMNGRSRGLYYTGREEEEEEVKEEGGGWMEPRITR